MKILPIVVILATSNQMLHAGDLNGFFVKADRFISQHVENGMVDYSSVQSDTNLITDLLGEIADMDLDGSSEAAKKAFYINAYNILIITEVALSFPVSSPLEIDGLFEGFQHTIAGEQMTLSDLENNLLRPKFNDARIHFAIVCAARGCPPLISKAYNESNLETLLEQQTFNAINSDLYVELSEDAKTVKLSRLFQWYAEDYYSEGLADVIGFINEYRIEKLDPEISIEYLDYDWGLNSIE